MYKYSFQINTRRLFIKRIDPNVEEIEFFVKHCNNNTIFLRNNNNNTFLLVEMDGAKFSRDCLILKGRVFGFKFQKVFYISEQIVKQ